MTDQATALDRTLLELGRLVAFAAINAGIVGVASWALCRALPPLRDEPATLVVVPMLLITGLGSVLLHRVVRRLRNRAARALALWVAFEAALVVFGVYLSISDGGGSPAQWARLHTRWTDYVDLIPAALFFGHFLGAPVLLLVGAADMLLSRWLTPRPARG